tara:strand:- start:627 stop:1028 length:402 start_codon:yes stop_codon:yes gene_type:complete
MRKLLTKILKRFGYVKQTSYRFYIKDTDWIQVVVSPKGIYNKTVEGHTLPISELAIYKGECLKLEDTYNPDRTKETDLLEWYNMGDSEIIEGDGMMKQIGKSNRKTWEEIKKSFDKMSPEDIQRIIENSNNKS